MTFKPKGENIFKKSQNKYVELHQRRQDIEQKHSFKDFLVGKKYRFVRQTNVVHNSFGINYFM